MGLCSFLKPGYYFCLWPKSVAANMVLTFLPGSSWASSLYLHTVFPKVGLVQGCSLGSDPSTQWQSRGQRRAVGVELTALSSPLLTLQSKHRDSAPYAEYGGWYKACKVSR